jgi:hypothetical protein
LVLRCSPEDRAGDEVVPPRRASARSIDDDSALPARPRVIVGGHASIGLRALRRSADFCVPATRTHCMPMNSPRNAELRVVSAAAEATGHRATLRIDAERPVPAPPLASEAARDRLQSAAERELDRLHQAAITEQVGLGQHMNWLIASQAILIHAFLMLFVVSSLGVVALNQALLGGLALVGIFCAAALHASIDHSSKTLALLTVRRRAVELELAAASGRAPSLPGEGSRHAGWAGPLFVVTWLLLAASAAILLR